MSNIVQLHINGRSVLHRPATNPDQTAASLILLHGYGADEYDLMGLANYFNDNIQVFSIRGSSVTPYRGASWFDIDMLADGSLRFHIDQAKNSAEGVIQVITQLKREGVIQANRLILAGFSQGATISNLITFQKPELIQALLIMSGRLPEDVEQLSGDASRYLGLPVFAGHGLYDNVIPIEYGRQIVSFWDSISDLEHFEYPMGHEISQEELVDIQKWMGKVLTRS